MPNRRTTSAPEILLSLVRRRGDPLRDQVERELRAAIQSGRLRPGARLPSTRALAADLGLSRGLVVEAYEQLLAEGYLTAAQGSSTRVTSRPSAPARQPDAAAPPQRLRFDFRPGIPDPSLFPRQAWLRSVRRAVTDAPSAALGYSDPRGAEAMRLALSAYLNRVRATVAHAENIVLCSGLAQGLRLACEALYARGARSMVVEDPWHGEERAIVRSAGFRIIPIPVDRHGLCVERLRSVDADAAVVTPAHQFPTGAVLAPKRRAGLLGWARRHRATIIEDDYDAEYRYDREPVGTLQGLAPDCVIYGGSASKKLAPALRLGWLVLPPDLVRPVAAAKRLEDLGSPALDQLAFADFVEHGQLDRHLRRTRRVYRRRRDVLVSALYTHLPELRIHGVAAGLHIMVELPRDADERRVVAMAAEHSIGVYAVGTHRAQPRVGPPALLLGYGNMREKAIARGIEELARVMSVARWRRAPARARNALSSGV